MRRLRQHEIRSIRKSEIERNPAVLSWELVRLLLDHAEVTEAKLQRETAAALFAMDELERSRIAYGKLHEVATDFQRRLATEEK